MEINLGAIPRTEDKRDFNLGKIQATQKIPDEYLPDVSFVKRNYQGQTPTCGAHALSHLKEIQECIETGESKQFTPRFNWIQIKQTDGYPLDAGTDMRAIMKSLSSDGVLDISLLNNDITLPLEQYSDKSVITPTMQEVANPYVIGSYAFMNFPSFDEVKQAIYKNRVVILLMQVGTGFWHTQYPKDETRPYGHFVVATGYTKDSIRILDSSDPDDILATKYLDREYAKAIRELGSTVDIPNNLIPLLKTKVSLLKQLVQLYIKLKGQKK